MHQAPPARSPAITVRSKPSSLFGSHAHLVWVRVQCSRHLAHRRGPEFVSWQHVGGKKGIGKSKRLILAVMLGVADESHYDRIGTTDNLSWLCCLWLVWYCRLAMCDSSTHSAFL